MANKTKKINKTMFYENIEDTEKNALIRFYSFAR